MDKNSKVPKESKWNYVLGVGIALAITSIVLLITGSPELHWYIMCIVGLFLLAFSRVKYEEEKGKNKK